jgi:hypothetical protein
MGVKFPWAKNRHGKPASPTGQSAPLSPSDGICTYVVYFILGGGLALSCMSIIITRYTLSFYKESDDYSINC